jgi:chaperonin cofactor prefoldin
LKTIITSDKKSCETLKDKVESYEKIINSKKRNTEKMSKKVKPLKFYNKLQKLVYSYNNFKRV